MSSEVMSTPKTEPSTSENNTADENEQGTSTTVCANTGSMEVVKCVSADVDEYIRLRIITSDMTNEVHFRVKAATSLGRLKRTYCSKLGFQSNELRFVFDGHRITDEDTPDSLGMLNGDVIEIYQERTGGM